MKKTSFEQKYGDVFIAYDPNTCTKLNYFPNQSIDEIDGRIPPYIYDAIRRAKELTKFAPVAQLNADLTAICEYLKIGGRLIPSEYYLSNQALMGDGDADRLKAYFDSGHYQSDKALIPYYFGLLTLAIAGNIFNLIWPKTKLAAQVGKLLRVGGATIPDKEVFDKINSFPNNREYNIPNGFIADMKKVFDGSGLSNDLAASSALDELSASNKIVSKNIVMQPLSEFLEGLIARPVETISDGQLAQAALDSLKINLSVEALRSAFLGEGILAGNRYTSEKINNAKGSPKPHQKLYQSFIGWALNCSKNHGFSSTEDAVNLGYKPYLEKEEAENQPDELLSNSIRQTTHKRLKKKLEEHCHVENIEFPFPRTRSKNN